MAVADVRRRKRIGYNAQGNNKHHSTHMHVHTHACECMSNPAIAPAPKRSTQPPRKAHTWKLTGIFFHSRPAPGDNRVKKKIRGKKRAP